MRINAKISLTGVICRAIKNDAGTYEYRKDILRALPARKALLVLIQVSKGDFPFSFSQCKHHSLLCAHLKSSHLHACSQDSSVFSICPYTHSLGANLECPKCSWGLSTRLLTPPTLPDGESQWRFHGPPHYIRNYIHYIGAHVRGYRHSVRRWEGTSRFSLNPQYHPK